MSVELTVVGSVKGSELVVERVARTGAQMVQATVEVVDSAFGESLVAKLVSPSDWMSEHALDLL